MDPKVEKVCTLLKQFVEGTDRSLEFAGRLEVAIDEAFPDDDDLKDLVLALACYQPGGGPFLYNEEQILRMCQSALASLRVKYGAC